MRHVLGAVTTPPGAGRRPADRLKGGRALGPMERIVIVALVCAGEPGAAGVIVAAKALVRFPELSRPNGAELNEVTEYFLVGSLSSWLVALAGLGLLALTW